MTPAIEVRNVYRAFGRVRAVDGVSLLVPPGSVMGIVGESGCGKSTLARIILGLMPATSGVVLVDGKPLATLDRRARARQRRRAGAGGERGLRDEPAAVLLGCARGAGGEPGRGR